MTVLKSSRSRNSTATVADVGPAARDGVLEPVEEQVAVGEPGQRVVERLAAQLVDQPVVLEGHRRFGGERRRLRDVPTVEEVGLRRGRLDGAEHPSPGDQRQHHHRALADGVEVGDLRRVGVRVVIREGDPRAAQDLRVNG